MQAEASHQPFDRASGDGDAFAVQLQPHLPGPVDAVVRRVDPHHLSLEPVVADLPAEWHLAKPLEVRLRSRTMKAAIRAEN